MVWYLNVTTISISVSVSLFTTLGYQIAVISVQTPVLRCFPTMFSRRRLTTRGEPANGRRRPSASLSERKRPRNRGESRADNMAIMPDALPLRMSRSTSNTMPRCRRRVRSAAPGVPKKINRRPHNSRRRSFAGRCVGGLPATGAIAAIAARRRVAGTRCRPRQPRARPASNLVPRLTP